MNLTKVDGEKWVAGLYKEKKLNYPEGSVLIDVRYYKPRKDQKEQFEVIYFDPIMGSTQVQYEPAVADLWILKKEFRHEAHNTLYWNTDHPKEIDFQIPEIEMEKCYRIDCKISAIPRIIMEECGEALIPETDWIIENDGRKHVISTDSVFSVDMDIESETESKHYEKKLIPPPREGMTYREYYEEMKDQISSIQMQNMILTNPYAFKADFQPNVYFRLRWIRQFGTSIDISKCTTSFLDIEVDVLDGNVNMNPGKPEDAFQPINATTLILQEQKKVILFALAPRPKSTLDARYHELLEKQKEEYEWLISHKEEFVSRVINEDEDNKKYVSDYEIIIHTFPYEKEINMIATIFAYINKYKPTFCEAWNARFDWNYLYYRIMFLGYDPLDIIIPKGFENKRWYYKYDWNASTITQQRDWCFSSTYTIYICQMRTYAAIRKSQKNSRQGFGLAVIAKKEAKITKLTDTKSGKFKEFAYTDYVKFLLYNIRDVVCQLAIELATMDSLAFLSRSYQLVTAFDKCFQETHTVRNSKEQSFNEQHFVQTQKLLIEPNIDHSFQGAFVADPTKNNKIPLIISGKMRNTVIIGSVDADAAAYYPTQFMAYNEDPRALIFKINIDNSVFISSENINRSYNQEYTWKDTHGKYHQRDLVGPIINGWKNHNICSTLYNYFSIPSPTEYFEEIDRALNIGV